MHAHMQAHTYYMHALFSAMQSDNINSRMDTMKINTKYACTCICAYVYICCMYMRV